MRETTRAAPGPPETGNAAERPDTGRAPAERPGATGPASAERPGVGPASAEHPGAGPARGEAARGPRRAAAGRPGAAGPATAGPIGETGNDGAERPDGPGPGPASAERPGGSGGAVPERERQAGRGLAAPRPEAGRGLGASGAAAGWTLAEHRLLAALRRCGQRPGVAAAARGLSLGGEHGALWLAAGLTAAALDRPRRSGWLRSTALIAGAHLASMGVKRLVRRPRPAPDTYEPLVRTAGRHSFPSSHATSAAAAVVAFGTLHPTAGRLAAPLAGAVCLSRLVVGVHYPSDIAAGVLLGATTAAAGGHLLPPALIGEGRRFSASAPAAVAARRRLPAAAGRLLAPVTRARGDVLS